MPLLLEYFGERAREHLPYADTLDGSYGFHNLNPSAGLYGRLHSSTGSSKELARITATTDSLAIQPTKVSRKKEWGPPFYLDVGVPSFAGANENAEKKLQQQIALQELHSTQSFRCADILDWNERQNSYLENLEKFALDVFINSVQEKVLVKCNVKPIALDQIDAAVSAGKHVKGAASDKKMKGRNGQQDIVGDQTEDNARSIMLKKRNAVETFLSSNYSAMDLHDFMNFGANGELSLHGYKSIRDVKTWAKHLAVGYVPDGKDQSFSEDKTPFVCTRLVPGIEWSVAPKENVGNHFPKVVDIENIIQDSCTSRMFLKTANAQVQSYNQGKQVVNATPSNGAPLVLEQPNSSIDIEMAHSDVDDQLQIRNIITRKESILNERWKVQVQFQVGERVFEVNTLLKMQKISSSNPENVVIAQDASNNILQAFTRPILHFTKIDEATPPIVGDKTPPMVD